jgi:acetyltransferase-like isoleucine patch superfamily enzyme
MLRATARNLMIAARGPLIVGPERISGINTLAGLHSSSQLAVWPESAASQSWLALGNSVYVGRNVEIAAVGPGTVEIGDETTFQDGCQIYGDVSIGAHCIFARNVRAISTSHQFRQQPEWLIRDQDEFFYRNLDESQPNGKHIRIEDDCWLGWSCAVMPGVYIGRGAVIGTNCVITKDVGPYEIHGGVPNKTIGTRLDFAPPARISAMDDAHLPYFYRGFRLAQAALAASRRQEIVAARRSALLVMAPAEGSLKLAGTVTANTPISLSITVNGETITTETVTGAFVLTVPVTRTTSWKDVPAVLRQYTVIEINETAHRQDAASRFGIRSAEWDA